MIRHFLKDAATFIALTVFVYEAMQYASLVAATAIH